jgi:hypothetical protein
MRSPRRDRDHLRQVGQGRRRQQTVIKCASAHLEFTVPPDLLPGRQAAENNPEHEDRQAYDCGEDSVWLLCTATGQTAHWRRNQNEDTICCNSATTCTMRMLESMSTRRFT